MAERFGYDSAPGRLRSCAKKRAPHTASYVDGATHQTVAFPSALRSCRNFAASCVPAAGGQRELGMSPAMNTT